MAATQVTADAWVWLLAWCRRLRIHGWGIGSSHGLDSFPGLGTSIYCRYGHKVKQTKEYVLPSVCYHTSKSLCHHQTSVLNLYPSMSYLLQIDNCYSSLAFCICQGKKTYNAPFSSSVSNTFQIENVTWHGNALASTTNLVQRKQRQEMYGKRKPFVGPQTEWSSEM